MMQKRLARSGKRGSTGTEPLMTEFSVALREDTIQMSPLLVGHVLIPWYLVCQLEFCWSNIPRSLLGSKIPRVEELNWVYI